MVRYFQAGTNIVGLPKQMVFLDKKGTSHLLPSLTPKHHIASHYGHSAIETAYNNKAGNLLKITKGTYTNYKTKVKKQQKAVKELVKANVAVETAAKKMRGRPRKNATVTAPSVVVVAPTAPKAKGRPRLSAEQKALREQIKADKKIAKELAKAQKVPKKKTRKSKME